MLTFNRQSHGAGACAVEVAALLEGVGLARQREGVRDPRAERAGVDGRGHLAAGAVQQAQVVHEPRARAAVAGTGAQHHGVAGTRVDGHVHGVSKRAVGVGCRERG